jgi:hypothetical protein
METQPTHPISERPCPLTFVMPAGLIGGLIWLCMLLSQAHTW